MKEIKVKNLKIRNFLSIGNEGIEINFQQGLNVITGINRDKEDSKNGVGKSAIADACCFAIFGQPLRDIRIENIPNWKTGGSCEVSIEFTVIDNYIENVYRIERGLQPSRVHLFENGEDIARTIAKTNSTLKKILGTSLEMFEQSVIMSINQTESFLSKRPVVKRKFIEGIFKLDIFSEMLSVIRHDISESKRDFSIEKVRIEEIQKNLTLYKKQQTEYKEKRTERIQELEQRKTTNKQEIKQLGNKLENTTEAKQSQIKSRIEKLKLKGEDFRSQENALIHDNSTTQASVLTLHDKIREINEIGNNLCITCKRPFGENDKAEHHTLKCQHEQSIETLSSKITTIEKELKEIKRLEKLCKSEVDSLIKEAHQLELQQNEIENIKQRILQCGEWNKQIKIDIEALQTEKDGYIELIDDATARCKALTAAQEQIQHTLDILDISKFVVSEEGVRSFIVKKLLQMLNNRLNSYLKQLDANCICTFNEYFEETITNLKDRECSYFNFSDGERKRIDLAMLFTFLDLRRLQSNLSINFSFYDELLDSSLDSKGIESVLEILKDRISQYGESIFIISHKNEAIKHATGEIIYLEKQNEVTRRLEYGTTI